MFRIPLMDEDRALLLSPRWAELGVSVQTLLLVLLCAVPLGLVFWLYRYEMRLVAARTARVLLLLRVVALSLLVLLVGFQPVYARTARQELPGRVVLAIDVSESMFVADPQREPVEKLRLARGLKLAGDLASGTQLDDWIRQYDDKKPLRFVAPDEFTSDAARRRSEEALRKKAHDAVIERIDGLTRSQAVKQLLSPDGVRFLAQLSAKHNVEIIGFAADAQEVKLEAVNELFPKDPARVLPKKAEKEGEEEKPPVVARGGSTDISLPLLRAIERSGSGRGKVLGVVLMTDGQHNTGESPVRRAKELKEQGIPLYPVAFGADKPPMDAAVLAVTSPPSVFKDVDAPVKVRIRATGLKPQDIKVIVHKPGEEEKPLDQRILKHDGKDQEYFESFSVRMDKEGKQTVQVTVKPLGENVKEVNTANNQQSFAINVADDTSKVLLVDGEARWEFHYIWQALLRDRSMKVKSVVFQQPRLGKVPEKELEKMKTPLIALPPVTTADHDPLFDYDCIILGDVMPEQLGQPERLRLQKYVADRGGTLVVLAGKRAMPQAFLPQAADNPGKPPAPVDPAAEDKQDPLIKMLPIENPRVVAPLDGFPVTLTEEGKQTDFLKLEAEGTVEDSLKRWAAMPRHHWGVVGKAKPGATTLAYVVSEDEKNLTPEQRRKKEQESALMVRHNYGFGRVFFVGVDSTWRYRYRIGDAYHHRFWSQTIRWAASDKPLVTGNRFVRFGTPQAMFREDEPVKLTVRLSEEIEKLPPGMKPLARIIRKEEDNKEKVETVVPLTARPLQPRLLEGQVRDLPAGKYEIELVLPELDDKLQTPPTPGSKPGALRASFGVMPGDNGELAQLATNFTLLKELADKNGTAKVYTPETAGELIELLTKKGIKKTENTEDKLWRWWVMLVVILGLLTIEWVMRKWAGLP